MPGNTPDEAVQQAFVSEIQQMLSEAEETGAAVPISRSNASDSQ